MLIIYDVVCPFCESIVEVNEGEDGICYNCNAILDDKGNVLLRGEL